MLLLFIHAHSALMHAHSTLACSYFPHTQLPTLYSTFILTMHPSAGLMHAPTTLQHHAHPMVYFLLLLTMHAPTPYSCMLLYSHAFSYYSCITSQDLSRDLAKLVCIGVDVHWYSIPMYCFSRICHLFSRNLIFY
jgi:hypothetical protein